MRTIVLDMEWTSAFVNEERATCLYKQIEAVNIE